MLKENNPQTTITESQIPSSKTSFLSFIKKLQQKKIVYLFILIILVSLYYLGNFGSRYYKTVSQNDPNSYSESTLLTPPPNFTPPVTQISKVSSPKSDTEIILFSGILHKDLRFDSQPWYRLPNGTYESEFDRQNNGNFLLKVLDKDGKTIKQYQRDTKSMFIMFVDPGGSVDVDQTPVGISIPYSWNARFLTLEIDGKIIFNEQIYVKLFNDYLNNLPNDIFVTSRTNFNNRIKGVLTDFKIKLEENNDISAARILEYDLLPIIQTELKSNIKKNNILETSKEEIIDLLTNTVARLDSSTATYPLSSTPTIESRNDDYPPDFCINDFEKSPLYKTTVKTLEQEFDISYEDTANDNGDELDKRLFLGGTRKGDMKSFLSSDIALLKTEIIQKAKEFVLMHKDIYGFEEESQLVVNDKMTYFDTSGYKEYQRWNVDFTFTDLDGVRLPGSIFLELNKAGEVFRFWRNNFYTNIPLVDSNVNLQLNPKLSINQALSLIREQKTELKDVPTTHTDLSIFPIRNRGSKSYMISINNSVLKDYSYKDNCIEYRLVWEIEFSCSSGLIVDNIYFVDAIDGKVLFTNNHCVLKAVP
ncbi:hypothetical protein A2W14_05905 [Candidatus Gottesmanbacteria bacterium RBG_16_37_8]|uniref:Uncharacterized protein n=1 Tax=Candidatus Gottesmanbacteria bacterium RBG_16_37_8 TaxID=1798371 RepID=A0A1F5YVH5_9BACT|nr:MAG: hypothetical protein A2W14_05905 [Candidatus Gottesmanbacteria bacterium RBG_16_37_8]